VAPLSLSQDWISDSVDIRQLLIETHGIPTDLGVEPSDFFDDIEKAGFAMFSKEPNIHPANGGKCVEWGYVKLRKEFFGARLE
jgi:Methyltransferase domain